MLIFAGLGNPGGQYQDNRHNIGFMAVDAIHRAHNFGPWVRKFKAAISEGTIGDEKVLLIKPQTFMNHSGESVGEAMRFYKLTPADITVFHDELDLPAGKVRVKTGGGNGGHNGLRSMDAHCTRDYRRVRLGIGHPGNTDLVHNHVLGNFAKADLTWLEPLLDDIARNADLLLTGDGSQFMNKLAGATPEAPKPSAAKAQPAAKSHIRQARDNKPSLPVSGPMADMLRKLLGDKKD